MNYVSAKYTTNTQTQANVNDCNTGTNCGITSPQIQGNGTANSPTNLQISKFNEEEEEEYHSLLRRLRGCPWVEVVKP